MRPIPKRLLIHTAELLTVSAGNGWSGTDGESGKKLSHVRIDPTTTMIQDSQNRQIQLTAVMLYDCKNSAPRGITFAPEQVVVFNGKRMTVKSVDELSDNQGLHHVEVGLV